MSALSSDLSNWEYDNAQLEARQVLRDQIAAKHVATMEEDHCYLTNEMSPLEKDEMLNQILFIMQDTPQKDRESEISDEVYNKMKAVAKRLADQEVS